MIAVTLSARMSEKKLVREGSNTLLKDVHWQTPGHLVLYTGIHLDTY